MATVKCIHFTVAIFRWKIWSEEDEENNNTKPTKTGLLKKKLSTYTGARSATQGRAAFRRAQRSRTARAASGPRSAAHKYKGQTKYLKGIKNKYKRNTFSVFLSAIFRRVGKVGGQPVLRPL